MPRLIWHQDVKPLQQSRLHRVVEGESYHLSHIYLTWYYDITDQTSNHNKLPTFGVKVMVWWDDGPRERLTTSIRKNKHTDRHGEKKRPLLYNAETDQSVAYIPQKNVSTSRSCNKAVLNTRTYAVAERFQISLLVGGYQSTSYFPFATELTGGKRNFTPKLKKTTRRISLH